MTSPEPLTPGPCFLALDLGTTTLAGRLLAADGTLLAEGRAANPQRALGADILTRLQHAREHGGTELQRLLLEGVRALVADLLAQADCTQAQIGAAAAAGNPGICHLLLNLPVETLIFPPHRTPLTTLQKLSSEVLNLNLSLGLYLFPAVSGFVGGDLVAVVFGAMGACGADESLSGKVVKSELYSTTQPLNARSAFNHSTQPQAAILVLDLGTNAELALWTGTRWLATSTAAGPAFEAGNIACGMPLAPGAVTDVQVKEDRLHLTIHGAGTPKGLCGSGLLALVATARAGGLIDASGRIVAPDEVGTNLVRYLVADGEGWAICFHRDARDELHLTQDDVRQLQLAKGAVRAGVEVLLDRAGLTAADVATVLVTGAFGSALPVASIKGMALLPETMLDKLSCIPNGVLDGLATFLAEPQGPERLTALHATVKPLPLSGTPGFERRFLTAIDFL